MKKIMAFNGSPRKSWNTSTLLGEALRGAASEGAETELIHLYDVNFKGCQSCFACKKPEGRSFGRCAVKDELSPILKRALAADGIILGSPVYFGTESGVMRMFRERLLFPLMTYTAERMVVFDRRMHSATFYTMNATDEMVEGMGLKGFYGMAEFPMRLAFGATETQLFTDTYQFDDYEKYGVTLFDEKKKAERREKVFPLDKRRAFEVGARFAREEVVVQKVEPFWD